jgi:Domain of unknown function (DUF2017)
MWRPLRRRAPGVYEVALDGQDREVLKALPLQLRSAMAANPDDEAFRRLFPPAYLNDEAAEKEYRQLIGSELEESRALALETLAKTANATELSEEQLQCWLRALNDVRLWLGTVLDVSEDDTEEEPEDAPHLLYQVLTVLQGLVIEVLTGDE